MFQLEKAITQWLMNLRKHRAFDDGTIQEMEIHLRDHMEDLMNQGRTEEEAFQEAIEAFGEVSYVAEEEFSNLKSKGTFKSLLFKAMLSNYFKTTMRGMMKHPLNSFINVFGLAVAIGACMVTYAFIDYDLSTDRFHEHAKEIFLSTYDVNRENTRERYGDTPAPLGAMLKEDFSNVKQVTRVHDGNAVVKYGDQVFHESIRYVDPSFLQMFTFPLQWGVKSALEDVNSIILSEETARKYFGEENPVGQEIELIVSDRLSKVFRIAGVTKPLPQARIIDFTLLTHIENLKVLHPSIDFNDWGQQLHATFIQVADPKEVLRIQDKMGRYKKLQNSVETDWAIDSFGFVSLHDLHLASSEIRRDISYDSSEEGRVGMPVIALFILALACFNYLNIAIVSASKRLKEIGMRKVIGASRRLIILQFITENLVLTLIAGAVGFLLAATVFLPWFSSFSSITSEFDLLDVNLWITLACVLLFTGFASGIYPAFYISKFQAITIFRGSVKFGKKNYASKVFLIGQLILTCVGIGFAVIFAQNSWYQGNREWGYEKEDVLYAVVQDPADMQKLKSAMEQQSGVLAAAGSQHHLSKKFRTTVVHRPDHEYEVHELAVGANYLEVMGLETKEGRFFHSDQVGDEKALVINELFASTLDLEAPIGQTVRIDSTLYEIIGVVEDFHFNNFYYEQSPTMFTLADESTHTYLSLKVDHQARTESYEALQKSWSTLFPTTPFNGGFQEDTWPGFYEDLNTMQRFTRAIAAVFVLLASLGLYGLIQLNVKGRVREFSIRKTLGADIWNLTSNIVSHYYFIFGIAILLGIPAAHMLNSAMLGMMFADPLPYGYLGAVGSAILLVLVLVAVVAAQVRKVSRSNPVDGLKTE